MAQRSTVFGLLLIFFFLGGRKTSAQSISRYQVSTTSSGYTNINGIIPTILGSGNDVTFPNIPIGFDFWYMGQKHTSVSASLYGWFTFGGSITTTSVNNLTSGGTRPVIAPLWDSMKFNPGLLGVAAGTFNYSNSGAIGSRIFTLQWHFMDWDATTAVLSPSVISFQALLYEATGDIEFIYNPGSRAVVSPSASAGITAVGSGAGNFLSLNSISAATIMASTTSETATIATKPSGSRGILFNPQETIAPSNLTFSAIGISGMQLNWIDSSSDETGFVIYRSTDNINFTHVTTTSANVTTYNDSGLSVGTTYYYRVYALRENLSGPLSGTQATLTNCTSFNLLQVSSANIVANYRLNGNASDFFGANNGVLQNLPTATTDRFEVSNGALAFNGSNQFVSTSVLYNNPLNYTTSIWFKTNTTTGGLLLGFSSSQTGDDSHDRHLYIGVDGKVHFGVYGSAGVKTLSTSANYNDGLWHMATATQSTADGISLYVDGLLIGTDPTAVNAENHTGFWRMAALNFNPGWPSVPTTNFNGSLDDAFIFNRVLTATEIQQLFIAPYGVQNNGPVCVGTTLNLVSPTIANATYAWVGPNGFTSNLQNPSLTYSLAAAGTYTLTVSMNGCSDVAYTKVISDTREGLWSGATSTTWSLAGNWCSGVVPSTSTNVTIANGKPRYPLVNIGAGFARNVIIANAASVVVDNQNLTIAGSISNSGIFNVANGTVTFLGGNGAQVIPANVFQDNLIKNLTVSNVAGVTLTGALRLTGFLNVSTGVLNANNDLLTLAANSVGSANVSSLVAPAYIAGRVKVENFIKGGAIDPFRTYRMLSSPVYDNSGSLILANTEGNRSAKFSQLIDDMILSGSTGVAGGFDATPFAQPSAWIFNNAFVPLTNINTSVNAGKGMYVFFRGNRDNFTGKTVVPFVPVEDTVIDFDGVLNQGDITVSLNHTPNGAFNLVGNPYAATIDWDSGNFTKSNVTNAIWIWRASSRSYATYISGVSQNGGSRYIASGQSFFVRSSDASPAITFREGVKSASPNIGVQPLSFIPSKMAVVKNSKILGVDDVQGSQASLSIIRIGVKSLTSYGEDESVIVFKDGTTPMATEEDAEHFDGEQINLSSLSSDGKKLAINFMPELGVANEIPLAITTSLTGDYVLSFDVSAYHGQYQISLKDKLLDKFYPVGNGFQHQVYVNKDDAQTYGNSRLSLVFEKPNVLPVAERRLTAKVVDRFIELSWLHSGSAQITRYRLLRAGADGVFSHLTNLEVSNNAERKFLDEKPLIGINYYRLEQLDLNGNVEMEVSTSVVFGLETGSDLNLYPNPARENFTVQFKTTVLGKVKIELLDVLGRAVYDHDVLASEYDNSTKINIASFQSGVYLVRVRSLETNDVVGQKVLVIQ
jgi:hypothetical protein